VPSAVGLAVLGEPLISAIYQGGKFSPFDTQQTALALTCYAIGLAGYSAVKILAPAFYALDDARTPTLISIVSIGINYFAASMMVHELGQAGLAISTSIVAIFSSLALLWAIRRRIGGIHGRQLLSTVIKVAAAAILMGAACLESSHLMREWLGIARWARVADLAVSISLGLAVFYGAARAMGVRELEMAETALWRTGVLE
jgi:putative peptidoglycan lipid II flippase